LGGEGRYPRKEGGGGEGSAGNVGAASKGESERGTWGRVFFSLVCVGQARGASRGEDDRGGGRNLCAGRGGERPEEREKAS
jgi:hypothetical protein